MLERGRRKDQDRMRYSDLLLGQITTFKTVMAHLITVLKFRLIQAASLITNIHYLATSKNKPTQSNLSEKCLEI